MSVSDIFQFPDELLVTDEEATIVKSIIKRHSQDNLASNRNADNGTIGGGGDVGRCGGSPITSPAAADRGVSPEAGQYASESGVSRAESGVSPEAGQYAAESGGGGFPEADREAAESGGCGSHEADREAAESGGSPEADHEADESGGCGSPEADLEAGPTTAESGGDGGSPADSCGDALDIAKGDDDRTSRKRVLDLDPDSGGPSKRSGK